MERCDDANNADFTIFDKIYHLFLICTNWYKLHMACILQLKKENLQDLTLDEEKLGSHQASISNQYNIPRLLF